MDQIIKEMLLKAHSTYYGLFLAEIEIKYSKIIPTACISYNKLTKKSEMIFNPEFIADLTNPEITFLLRHELEHYINCHYFYSKEFGWDKEIANISCDCSINSELMDFIKQHKDSDMSMPKGGVLPSSFPEFKFEELRESKYYYDILIQKQGKKEKEGSSGSKAFDKILDDAQAMHELWDSFNDLADLDVEIIKQDLDAKIQEIKSDTIKLKGNVPNNISSPLDVLKLEAPVIPWNKFFKLFMGSSMTSFQENTRKRPNYRFEDSLGRKFMSKCVPLVLFDSSGSLNDNDLMKFNNEIQHMHKCGHTIYKAAWDGDCEIPTKYDGKFKNLVRTKNGGTLVNNAVLMANEQLKKIKHDVVIMFTDGYIGEITVRSHKPMIVIITSDGNMDFDNPLKYKTIKIN
jgi:predicted metal-dependent peptidase